MIKLIINSQKLAHIQLNSQLLLITKEPQSWLVEMSNFSFLKQQIKTYSKIKNLKH
jgi:hypothetical protein